MLFLAFVAAGCSPAGIPTNHVEGIVTVDGQPLEGATVRFVPAAADGNVATGTTDAQGKYLLTADGGLPQKGAIAGDYNITVVKMDIKDVVKPSAPGSKPPGEYDKPDVETIQTLITPKIYAEAGTTPLKATVAKGKNDIPLEMKSK